MRNRSSILDLLRDRLDTDAPTVMAYLDLDGFKRVNDVGGHAEGDRLLIAVAHALVDVLPEAVVGRIGGDEFVVVAAERPAAALGEEIRAVVAGVERARRAGVTASVGVAVARDGEAPRDLLHRADEDMYADKRSRRSRLVAGEGAPAPRG